MSLKKPKTQYVCQSCGTAFSKWQGQCSACNEWNTIIEEIVVKSTPSDAVSAIYTAASAPVPVSEISSVDFQRYIFSGTEMNRVLGGGLVPGSISLIAGEPGIGKSTLMLDLALKYNQGPVLYVSGEESAGQIKMRADRIGKPTDNCFIYCETDIDQVLLHARQIKPRMIVIDSVQTMYTQVLDTPAGAVGQIRECAARLQQYAKNNNVSVFLVGHITKDGYIAGPKLLEHMVDTVLYFEGDRHFGFRILRSMKNRFGSTSEIEIGRAHV